MTQATVTMPIPFESLVAAVKALGNAEQLKLYSILKDQIAAMEEEMIDNDPELSRVVLEAKADYEAGDFVTLEEYIAKQDGMA